MIAYTLVHKKEAALKARLLFYLLFGSSNIRDNYLHLTLNKISLRVDDANVATKIIPES
ncbi:hypothetical protein GCM10028895_27380 [Pontibacter rugosus]